MAKLTPLNTLLNKGADSDAVQALEQLAAARHLLDDAAFRQSPDPQDQVNVPVTALDRIVHQSYGYGAGDVPGALEADFASLSRSEARLIIRLAAAAADQPTAEQPTQRYLVDLDRTASTYQSAFIRIDIRTWVSALDGTHPLSEHIEGLLVVSAARSFVDITQMPLYNFMTIYQHQLTQSNRSAKDVIDALETVRHVWHRGLERLQA